MTVIVTNPDKIKKIKTALESDQSAFTDIRPTDRDKLPENAKAMWYKESKKINR